MTEALFHPFDFKKWLVLGFTAWLAGLASRGGGSGANTSIGDGRGIGDVGGGTVELWETIVENGLWLILGGFGCAILVSLLLAIFWVSCRGKFMFLDNVVYNRAEVVAPWKRFRRQGNSLFFFTLAFVLVSILLTGVLALAIVATVGLGEWREFETVASIGLAVAAAGALALLVLAMLYGVFFLNAFVIPLMHRYDLTALDAWRRFLGIFAERAWAFLVCGLLVFIAMVGVLIGVFAFGLLTCCLGFLLLILPYVSSVFLLPISVLYRGFTIEFLAQFDAGLLPESAAAPPTDEPSPPPTTAAPA